jgi:signal transduction histidine kinase/ActR/RegA family two-component response regulator
MNLLLQRYLRKMQLEPENLPINLDSWNAFLSKISEAFDEAEADRRMMEHSLEKSSAEMMELYENLKVESEKLRQSQKMEAIGSLAGGIAHDFNNLLAVIVCYAELILSKLNPNDPLMKQISSILHAANRGSDLTKQLLAFTRQQVLQPVVLSPARALSKMQGLFSRLIGETIEFTTELDSNSYSILVDPGQFEQVIMNLVVNARDAVSLAGRIHIKLSNCPDGSGVFIEVSDTGKGIPLEIQSRIFEPFFTTKETGKGTGLGLSTVLGIVEQSHGDISLKSTPGHGTTFKLFFPKTDQVSLELEEVMTTQDQKPPQTTTTILLVEDEAVLMDIVSEILTDWGYQVLRANSGLEALDLAQTHLPNIDLLLTDVVMPGMSGGALAQNLLTQRPNLKVVFMSGYTDDSVLKHGIASSEVTFIQKPFSPQALLSRVQETLGLVDIT